MRVGVPVGEYHRGNTSDYVLSALSELGHDGLRLTEGEFFEALRSASFDCYLCVDSGRAIDLRNAPSEDLSRVGYWFIDYRHNKDRRTPTDFEVLHALTERGGWAFQSQFEDVEDCSQRGVTRASWLPLAADPSVWSDTPVPPKEFHLAFAGNVWDPGRAAVLQLLLNRPEIRFLFPGHGAAWKEEGADLLRRAVVGFNVNSWYGEPYAFDVNMRVFETLSCGLPLITNEVQSLWRLFPKDSPFLRTYSAPQNVLATISAAFADQSFLTSGVLARQAILSEHTYAHRLRVVLDKLVPEGARG